MFLLKLHDFNSLSDFDKGKFQAQTESGVLENILFSV